MDPRVFHKISYGLYVVSSRKGEGVNGQIANTIFQVTSQPPQIAACINTQNLTHEFIRESGVFAVSILSQETPLKFIGHFGFRSGREFDKFRDIPYKLGVTGAPIALENALAYLEAEVSLSFELGTHTLFIGRVVAAEVLREGEPMTYAYYHMVKGGRTPRTAPVFHEEKPEKEVGRMQRYRCTVCGYIYDPENGDPDSGVEPGTSFEDLPDDWVCPVCGAAKDAFERED